MRLMGEAGKSVAPNRYAKRVPKCRLSMQVPRGQLVAYQLNNVNILLASHEWDFSVQFWDAQLQTATNAQCLLKLR